jgi:hypothetical protein
MSVLSGSTPGRPGYTSVVQLLGLTFSLCDHEHGHLCTLSWCVSEDRQDSARLERESLSELWRFR